MRRLVVALIAALTVLSLAGCGGGGEAPPPEAATPAPAPVTAAAPAAEIPNPLDDRSSLSTETWVPFSVEGTLPVAVQQRLDEKQAMILFFYNGAQAQTDDLREQVDTAVEDNAGQIDLLAYDLGKATSIDKNGVVVVDETQLAAGSPAAEAARLARQVGVKQTPYLMIIDDQGYLIFWNIGYIDSDLLTRQIQRAAD